MLGAGVGMMTVDVLGAGVGMMSLLWLCPAAAFFALLVFDQRTRNAQSASRRSGRRKEEAHTEYK